MLMEFFIGMRIANAVSDPERISLLRSLVSGETRVETLMEGFTGTREDLLSQLKVLAEANLVESRSDGFSVLYRIAPESEGILKNLLGGGERRETSPCPDGALPGRAAITTFAV